MHSVDFGTTQVRQHLMRLALWNGRNREDAIRPEMEEVPRRSKIAISRSRPQ